MIMPRLKAAWIACSLAILSASATPLLAKKTKLPAWVEEARARTAPSALVTKNCAYVILHDTIDVEIDRKGTLKTTTRAAYLVRTPDGRDAAVAHAYYSADTDKVLSLKAWTIPAAGDVISYEKKDIVDKAKFDKSTVATSARLQIISAKGDALPGSIFAYEAVIEDRGVFAEIPWYFQSHEPSLYSEISLKLAPEWKHKTRFFNMEELAPMDQNGRLVWRQSNLPALKLQPGAPSRKELARWMVIGLSSETSNQRVLYRSWEQISQTQSPRYEEKSQLAPELASKAAELTVGASTLKETVKPLAELAQSVNYIAHSLDLGRGEGFVPRAATEVFKTHYGDCKDKTTLLMALLKSKGIHAYPLIVHSADGAPEPVFADWPTPIQFNHCIAAIQADDSIEAPATIDHPTLGKLIIFDPTDEFTAFGDLPHYLQGNKGLILAAEQGGLIDLPELPLTTQALERQALIRLGPTGAANGQVHELSRGQAACRERRDTFINSKDYDQAVKNWLSQNLRAVTVVEHKHQDNRDADSFTFLAGFQTPRFGNNLGGKLLTFDPIFLSKHKALNLGDDERAQPYRIPPRYLKERNVFLMPEGFRPLEIPADTTFANDFGSYKLTFETKDNTVIVTRILKMNPMLVPLERIEELKAVYDVLIKAENTPIVLEKADA